EPASIPRSSQESPARDRGRRGREPHGRERSQIREIRLRCPASGRTLAGYGIPPRGGVRASEERRGSRLPCHGQASTMQSGGELAGEGGLESSARHGWERVCAARSFAAIRARRERV